MSSHPLFSRLRDAVVLNFRPGLVIWSAAGSLLLAWHHWPAARDALTALMTLKQTWGSLFAFVSGAVFSGLLPRLVMVWLGFPPQRPVAEMLFAAAFWGYRSVEVDYFYQWQTVWFGNGTGWRTIACKTLVDQLVYSALWAVPTVSVSHAWKDAGFSWARARAQFDRDFLRLRLPAAILANIMVWTPTVVVIYLLPQTLQLPVSNLVATFGVLMVLLVLRPGAPPSRQDTM